MSEKKHEQLLRLANMTGLKNPEKFSDYALELEIKSVMDDMLSKFYYHDQNDYEASKPDEKDASLSEEEAYAELEEAEESGEEPPEEDVARYNYNALNALTFDECKFLYGLLHSDDKTLKELATSAYILSVRAAIVSLIQRVHFYNPAGRNNLDPVRGMRSAGISAAMKCLETYNPNVKGAASFFTFSYTKIWRYLLAEMYGYDPENDAARVYNDRSGKIKAAVEYYRQNGELNPTDEQIASYINQNSSRNKDHAISVETVRALRKTGTYQEEAAEEEASTNNTDNLETMLTIERVLKDMPEKQRDVIKIILHLNAEGQAIPDAKSILSLMERRYPDADRRDLENTIISAKLTFKKLYYGKDYEAPETVDPLLDAIMALEDYSDEMLNLLENTDFSDIF